MRNLTKQEIFNTVVTHLRNQGQKSTNKSGKDCMYRSPAGLKCAAGCLITDENYNPSLELKSVCREAVSLALEKSGVNMFDEDINAMVMRLQQIHDFSAAVAWEKEFEYVAKNYSLTLLPLVA